MIPLLFFFQVQKLSDTFFYWLHFYRLWFYFFHWLFDFELDFCSCFYFFRVIKIVEHYDCVLKCLDLLLLDLGEVFVYLASYFLFFSTFFSFACFRDLIGLSRLVNGDLVRLNQLVIIANQTAAWLFKSERKHRLHLIVVVLFVFASLRVNRGFFAIQII